MSELVPHADMPTSYNRKILFAQAHRKMMGRDERGAIALYRQLMMDDPGDVQVSLRLAPLLARRGQDFEAWRLFSDAGRKLLRTRRNEQALSVFREACRFLPHQFDAWRIRAEIELKLGWEDTAFETLVEGRHHFRSAHVRAQAIALLCMARTIEPWDPGLLLDLAHLYAQTDQAAHALELLAGLAVRSHGSMKRRVRGAQFRITYSPRHLWLWLKALGSEIVGGDTGISATPSYALTLEDTSL